MSVKLASFSFESSLVLSVLAFFNYIWARAFTEVLQWEMLMKSCNCRLEGIGVTIQETSKTTPFSYFPPLGEMET